MKKIDTPEGLLRLLADTIPGLIAFLDRNLEYRYLNGQYSEWFGIEPSDYIGKTPLHLMGSRAFETVRPLYERALAGERIIEELKMNYRFGGARDVRLYLIPHISDGGVLGLCAMVIDITEEKKIREKLEEATRAKSRFLAAASHDLRQPLHAMTLLAHALRRRTRDMPEVVEMLAHMDDALRTLRRMFEALLDVSKLDAGVINTEPRIAALKPLLRSACQTYSLEADKRGLRLSLVPIEAYVETDPAILEMTISNLIANALKFTAKGGVLVGCRRRGEKVRIEVYDTGAGIPADRLEAIFEEFEHSRSSAHGANEGMGLGLALVRRYCDIMGYELDVRSIPGRGSRFSIILPQVAAEDGDIPTKTQKSTRQSLEGVRILVLDDEGTVAFALSRDLKDRGADVVSAERTEDAETLLENGEWPDAAIVDYDLGGAEMGDEFIARVEVEQNKRLPTLILTGSTDPETLQLLAASGRRWLTKPTDPGVLSAAVAGLVQDRA
jgi:PAS domain S-box-containing protein